jgi:hypothetical protein
MGALVGALGGLVGACGVTEGAADGAAPPPDGQIPDGAAPDAVVAVSVSGDMIQFPDLTAVEGVTVTLVGHPEVPAVVSDTNGSYILAPVPARSDVLLHFEKAEYWPQVSRVLTIGEVDYAVEAGGALAVVSETLVALLESVSGIEQTAATGWVNIRMVHASASTPLAGATVAITPKTGPEPVYFNATGFPDPSLTETTTSGLVVFLNQEPGAATVTFQHPDLPTCWARGPDRPYPVRIEIQAGAGVMIGTGVCGE